MRDWLTYRLSDFLLFSPRTYYRMFELYHRDVWPVHVLSMSVVCGIVLVLVRATVYRERIVAALLALAWLWVGIAFHIQRYASINWAASYFGALFVAEAGLFVWVAVIHHRRPVRQSTSQPANRAPAIAFVAAAALATMVGPLADRSWTQAEMFGLTPDATSIATVALLAFLPIHWRRVLLVVPLIWCMIGAATLWALGSREAWLSMIAVVVALSSLRRMTPTPAQ